MRSGPSSGLYSASSAIKSSNQSNWCIEYVLVQAIRRASGKCATRAAELKGTLARYHGTELGGVRLFLSPPWAIDAVSPPSNRLAIKVVMSIHDHRLRNSIGYHARLSNQETRQREVVLRVAEQHFTAAEFAELVADVADNKVDVRIYDDGIVLMRQY